MMQVDARELTDPQLAFGTNKSVKATNGEWDVRSAVFKQESIRVLDIVNSRVLHSGNGGYLSLDRKHRRRTNSHSSSVPFATSPGRKT